MTLNVIRGKSTQGFFDCFYQFDFTFLQISLNSEGDFTEIYANEKYYMYIFLIFTGIRFEWKNAYKWIFRGKDIVWNDIDTQCTMYLKYLLPTQGTRSLRNFKFRV